MADDFSVGGLLSRTFGIWKSEFVTLTLLSALLFTPQFLIAALTLEAVLDPGWMLLNTVLGMLSGSVLSGATVFNVFQHARGRRASFRECLGIGLSRILPILGVSFLSGLGIMAGTIVFVIPGIILACMWLVAIPVTVVERGGPVQSLKRSAILTADKRGVLFWVGFVLILIMYTFILVGTGIGAAMTVSHPVMGSLISVGLTMLTAPMLSVAQSVAYSQLKLIKEGVGIDDLAAIFD